MFLSRTRVKFGNPAEKLKKNPREFLSNSLFLSTNLEKSETNSCFLPEVPEYFFQNMELMN